MFCNLRFGRDRAFCGQIIDQQSRSSHLHSLHACCPASPCVSSPACLFVLQAGSRFLPSRPNRREGSMLSCPQSHLLVPIPSTISRRPQAEPDAHGRVGSCALGSIGIVCARLSPLRIWRRQRSLVSSYQIERKTPQYQGAIAGARFWC